MAYVSGLRRVGLPVSGRFRRFEELFSSSLRDSGSLLDRILSCVGREGNGVVHPVLTLLVTGLFNRVGSSALRTTLSLRLLRATDLIRSSIISRDSGHHKRSSMGTVCGGGISILMNSCVLTADLGRSTVAHRVAVMSLITYLKRGLSRNRVVRLTGVGTSRFSRRICCSIVHGGATTLFATDTRTKTVSIRTSSRVIGGTHLFNRVVNVTFRVGSSVFSCCSSSRVNGPAKGSVHRKGLALPTLCILGVFSSRRVQGLTLHVQTLSTSSRSVTHFVRCAGIGKKVRCTERTVISCHGGTLTLLPRSTNRTMGSTLATCVSCIVRESG